MLEIRFGHIALTKVRLGKLWRSRRYDPADAAELAESTAEFGPMSPIIVAPAKEQGRYELVAGYRYFLAAKRLGIPTIIAGILDRPLGEAAARAIAEIESAPSRLSQADLIRLQQMMNGEGRTPPL